MHICQALGAVAHCGCHPGYQLAADRKACEGRMLSSLRSLRHLVDGSSLLSLTGRETPKELSTTQPCFCRRREGT